MSRREEIAVFLVEAALVVDLEEGFTAFLVVGAALAFAFVLEAVLTGLAATLGSLTSFLAVTFFAVSLASLGTVAFLAAGFFATEDFVALVVLDLDLEVDLAGAFLVRATLVALAGLFCLRYELCLRRPSSLLTSLVSSLFLVVVFGGSLTRPERPWQII